MKSVQKFLLMITVTMLLCGLFVISAYAETEGIYRYSVTDGKATITDVDTSVSGAVTIPSTLGGYPVTEIGDYAFYECTNLTSVTIGNGVTRIGGYAFKNCSSLITITIPDSMTSIGGYAFESCNSMTNLYISDLKAWLNVSFTNSASNPFAGNDNPHKLFVNGSLIEGEVIVPDGTIQIPSDAFFNCKNITSITLPNSVTNISDYAFRNCRGLINITMSNGVASIGRFAFSNCEELISVTIPNSVKSIGEYAFARCIQLTSITIPDSVTRMDDSAFRYCRSLASVTISNSISSLGNRVFDSCFGLTSVVMPAGLTNIGVEMFSNCSKLERVEIPESVTAILSGAFYNTAITDVYYRGTKSQWNAIAIASNNDVLDRATIHYETAMPEEPEPTPVLPYKVTALKVVGAGGSALTAPPENGGFIAEVSIAEVEQRASKDYFVLAAFDRNGRILGVNYARADIPTGGQISFGMTFPDYGKPIKKIKAFVWESLGGMTPLSETMEL